MFAGESSSELALIKQLCRKRVGSMGKVTGKRVACVLVGFHDGIASTAVRLNRAVMRKSLSVSVCLLRADFADSYRTYAF